MMRTIEISEASDPAAIAAARTLFQEYQEALGIDLGFQGFAAELETLPGAYASQQGRFDLYVGPAISWVRYDIGVDGAQDRDPEPGYGIKLGGEYLFGRTPWSLGFEYRHLELLRDGTDRDLYGDIGLGVGALVVGYRFGEGIR